MNGWQDEGREINTWRNVAEFHKAYEAVESHIGHVFVHRKSIVKIITWSAKPDTVTHFLIVVVMSF